ncbi:hypothetical protein A3J43_02685 [Candidatus Uhrbacteria bacterium RIFCSPHIGHO2_12_FULL_54_23]|nr:MAG: hypothetical protein A3J43_02685 [Candidatus Uhrbacteria bacterium RIFCSPHIGHO2_12_FULL_54_23]OGL84385.1 MAG: hypothetical protein A3B36_02535 [Candidatus Uhrbacteria bacterium RIFCSPLOWO2_01_FULL_55_36]
MDTLVKSGETPLVDSAPVRKLTSEQTAALKEFFYELPDLYAAEEVAFMEQIKKILREVQDAKRQLKSEYKGKGEPLEI